MALNKDLTAFDQDFDHYKKLYCITLFVEQLFAEHHLVEHLPMAAYIKFKII